MLYFSNIYLHIFINQFIPVLGICARTVDTELTMVILTLFYLSSCTNVAS